MQPVNMSSYIWPHYVLPDRQSVSQSVSRSEVSPLAVSRLASQSVSYSITRLVSQLGHSVSRSVYLTLTKRGELASQSINETRNSKILRVITFQCNNKLSRSYLSKATCCYFNLLLTNSTRQTVTKKVSSISYHLPVHGFCLHISKPNLQIGCEMFPCEFQHGYISTTVQLQIKIK